MSVPVAAAIAANRFGLGARPGELALIGGDARDWLRSQLRAAPPALVAPELRSSAAILAQALELRREIQTQRKAEPAAPAGAAADAAQQRLPQLLRPIYSSEVTARLQHAVSTERPFLERLTQFWTNHFAISVDKQFLAGLAGSFEREAIRPRVLGNFGDLLLAVETHPAMQLYLDNSCRSARIPLPLSAARATTSRASASTRTSHARFSSCTPSASVAATPRRTSPPLPR